MSAQNGYNISIDSILHSVEFFYQQKNFPLIDEIIKNASICKHAGLLNSLIEFQDRHHMNSLDLKGRITTLSSSEHESLDIFQPHLMIYQLQSCYRSYNYKHNHASLNLFKHFLKSGLLTILNNEFSSKYEINRTLDIYFDFIISMYGSFCFLDTISLSSDNEIGDLLLKLANGKQLELKSKILYFSAFFKKEGVDGLIKLVRHNPDSKIYLYALSHYKPRLDQYPSLWREIQSATKEINDIFRHYIKMKNGLYHIFSDLPDAVRVLAIKIAGYKFAEIGEIKFAYRCFKYINYSSYMAFNFCGDRRNKLIKKFALARCKLSVEKEIGYLDKLIKSFENCVSLNFTSKELFGYAIRLVENFALTPLESNEVYSFLFEHLHSLMVITGEKAFDEQSVIMEFYSRNYKMFNFLYNIREPSKSSNRSIKEVIETWRQKKISLQNSLAIAGKVSNIAGSQAIGLDGGCLSGNTISTQSYQNDVDDRVVILPTVIVEKSVFDLQKELWLKLKGIWHGDQLALYHELLAGHGLFCLKNLPQEFFDLCDSFVQNNGGDATKKDDALFAIFNLFGMKLDWIYNVNCDAKGFFDQCEPEEHPSPLSDEMVRECAATLLQVKMQELECYQPNNIDHQPRELPCFILVQDAAKVRALVVQAGFDKSGLLKSFGEDKNGLCLSWLQDNGITTAKKERDGLTFIELTSEQLTTLKVNLQEEYEPSALLLLRASPPRSPANVVSDSSSDQSSSDSEMSDISSAKNPPNEKDAEKKARKARKRKISANNNSKDEEEESLKSPAKKPKGVHHYEKFALNHSFQPTNLNPNTWDSKKEEGKPGDLPVITTGAVIPLSLDVDAFAGLPLWQRLSCSAASQLAQLVAYEEAKLKAILKEEALKYPIYDAINNLPTPTSAPCFFVPTLKNYQKSTVQFIEHRLANKLSPILALQMGLGKTYVLAEVILHTIYQKEGPIYLIAPKSLLLSLTHDIRKIFAETKQAIWQWYLKKMPNDKAVSDFWETLHPALTSKKLDAIAELIPLLRFVNQIQGVQAWQQKYNHENCLGKQLAITLKPLFGEEKVQQLETCAATQLILTLKNMASSLPLPPMQNFSGYSEGGLWRLRHYNISDIAHASDLKGFLAIENAPSRVIVTTVNALDSYIQKASQKKCSALFIDEAQRMNKRENEAYKKINQIITEIKNHQGTAPQILLSSATPCENNFIELWDLLALANPNQLDDHAHNALKKLFDTTQKALCNIGNDDDLMSLLARSFSQFYTFREQIAKPLVVHLTMQDTQVREDWEGQLPTRQDIDLHVRLNDLAIETIKRNSNETVFKKMSLFHRICWLPSNNGIKTFDLADKGVMALMNLSDKELLKSFAEVPAVQALLNCDEIKVLKGSNEHALCFVEHKAAAALLKRLIQEHLKDEAPAIEIMDGTMEIQKRNDILNRFRRGHGGQLLIMTKKTGGVGINLQIASKVFMLMSWNPFADEQAIARMIRANGGSGLKKVVTLRFQDDKTDVLPERHQRIIQDLKKFWAEFLWDHGDNLENSLDIWVKLLKKKCELELLNLHKDVQKTEMAMVQISEKIALARVQINKQLLQPLLDKVKVCPQVSAAAAVQTSHPSNAFMPLPIPLGWDKARAIQVSLQLTFNQAKCQETVPDMVNWMQNTPRGAELVRNSDPRAQVYLQYLKMIESHSFNSNIEYKVAIFNFDNQRYNLIRQEGNAQAERTLRLFYKKRTGARQQQYDHYDPLIRFQTPKITS